MELEGEGRACGTQQSTEGVPTGSELGMDNRMPAAEGTLGHQEGCREWDTPSSDGIPRQTERNKVWGEQTVT